ncbi:MAG TPA: hypothetical protein PK507_04220 [bacterium]|nr:hypothetical protein [bacterium]
MTFIDDVENVIKVVDGWNGTNYATECISKNKIKDFKKSFSNISTDVFVLYNIKEKKYIKSLDSDLSVSFTADVLKAKKYTNYIDAQFDNAKLTNFIKVGVSSAHSKRMCDSESLKTCMCFYNKQ